MANEIRVSLTAQVTNGGYTEAISEFGQYDQSTIGASSGVQVVGTSAEALDVGDIVNQGFLLVKNLDTTSTVSYGPNSSGLVVFGKLKPGEVHFFRIDPSVNMKWVSAPGSAKVRYLLLED